MAAVKPLQWISWQEARLRIPEIWDGWSWKRADQAMAHALRSGQVHYRAETCAGGQRSVAPQDVISTLVELRLYAYSAEVEYEITEVTTATVGSGALRLSLPSTQKRRQSAWLGYPELVWSEFRDYLIRFELPAGAIPKKASPAARRHQTPPSDNSGRTAKPIWRDIHPKIDDWLNAHSCPLRGDGKQADLERYVAALLQESGQDAGEATIRRHVKQRIDRRRATGSQGS